MHGTIVLVDEHGRERVGCDGRQNEFVLSVGRVCGVEIVLKDGAANVPWPNSTHATLEHTTKQSGVAYWSANRLAAQSPGEHRLTIGAIDGFAPVPPRTVVVEPGQWTKVEIALERTR